MILFGELKLRFLRLFTDFTETCPTHYAVYGYFQEDFKT